jgi:hypothetical protein
VQLVGGVGSSSSIRWSVTIGADGRGVCGRWQVARGRWCRLADDRFPATVGGWIVGFCSGLRGAGGGVHSLVEGGWVR